MLDLVRRKNKYKTSPGGDRKGSGSRQSLSQTGVIRVFRVQDVSSTFVNPADIDTDTKYTETPSFRTIHIPDSGHFVRVIPAPKFTCSGIFLVQNLHVPKNYCPVNSCIYDKF